MADDRSGPQDQTPSLRRLPKPATSKQYRDLGAPIARERLEGEPCRLIGKVFNWSPMFYEVAILSREEVGKRKVAKKRVHLERCPHCPDYRSS